MMHPVFNDIVYALEHYSERTALIDKDGESYTYGAFKTYISGAYTELSKRGIKKGSKVLVAVPMSMQLYAILEALFALGATAIFLDPWMKGKKMSSVIRQVQPDLFVVTKKLSRITWLLAATWPLKKWKINAIKPSNANYSIAAIKDDDNALITFTSGTSGAPKGANRTFAFLHAQAAVLKAHLGDSEVPSVDYSNFPIVGLANFALGNTVVVPKINLMKIHKADGSSIAADLKKNKVSRLVVSPSLLRIILSSLPKDNRIKTVKTGGAPISSQLVKTAVTQFPTIHFEGIFGSTEAEPIAISDFKAIKANLNAPKKGIYVGEPVPETQVKIIRPTTTAISTAEFENLGLNNGEPGELVVTGNHVNKNYYENPEAFKANKIADKAGTIWHRTGDIGYFEGNALYLVGRNHRIMVKEEKYFYPYPVEQLIEEELGLQDIGYIQNTTGEFIVYYHHVNDLYSDQIKSVLNENDYPIDQVIYSAKPLPRDARHKSKLQVEQLKQ